MELLKISFNRFASLDLIVFMKVSISSGRQCVLIKGKRLFFSHSDNHFSHCKYIS